MTTLHNQIMNIQCAPPDDANMNQRLSFKEGHKQARHAAAEIALASDARIAELEAEGLEQARIIGMGAERELALMARVSELEAWIRREGCISDTCTKSILGSVCDGCRCKNAK